MVKSDLVFDERLTDFSVDIYKNHDNIIQLNEDLIKHDLRNLVRSSVEAIYVISDVLVEDDWKLGWGEISLEKSINALIDMIIDSL